MTIVKLRHRYHRLAPPNEGIYESGTEIEVDDDTARQMATQQTAEIISTRPDPPIVRHIPNLKVDHDWAKKEPTQ